MRKTFLCSLLSLTIFSSAAQVVLQNNPPSLRWHQVTTPNFRVLYTDGFEQQAQRVANSLEHVREEGAESLGPAPRRTSVILQNHSSVSNGFASILPRRMEFYGMPTQDYNFLGTNDWLDMLTVHEYRHMVQYRHATRGFNKAIQYLFGNISLAGMAQVAAPSWFWEGDAVVAETALTPSGRGDIPHFGLLMRTNLLEGRKFNYHKQYLRSYKHNIPDHYELGYHMVSYLRERTGDSQVWSRITARSWSVPFIPFAFSNAIRKETGMYVTDLYNDMADNLARRWENQVSALTLTSFIRVPTDRRKGYTDYLYPQPLPDGSVLALKSGIGDVAQFVLLRNGEERVFIPGQRSETGMLSAAGDLVVWNEFGFDPRWQVRNYSQVKTYNLSTGKHKRVGKKRSRFAGAAITAKGDRIVTIETDITYKTSVVVLDATTGEEVKRFDNPSNDFFSMPRWSEDGSTVVVLRTTREGRTVTLIDYDSGSMRDVIPISKENIGYPVLHGDYLLFNSPKSGIDNIYALDLKSGSRFQVTSSRLGAYNPAVSADGRTLFYNDQSRDGMDVVRTRFDPALWKPDTVSMTRPFLSRHLTEQEGSPDIFANVPERVYPVSRYRKASGIFNPYSWGVAIEDDLSEASIGLVSTDILSTTSFRLGYYFDIKERSSVYRGSVSYQGWFPILDVSASVGNRKVNEGSAVFYDTLVNPVVTDERDIVFKWKEKNVQAGFRIPLNTTTSRYHGNVTFGSSIGLTEVRDFSNNIGEGGRLVPRGDKLAYFFRDYVDNGKLIYHHGQITAYRLLKRSRRDIYSRWGQQVELQSFATPFGGDFDGQQLSAFGVFFFPGFARHHSLWTYGAWQETKLEQARNNYVFRNQVPTPRGMAVSIFQQFYSFSANYTLPLWYPDIAIGPLVNIQRLRANVFYDYAQGRSPSLGSSRVYSSAGIEAKLDINLMRFLPQFDVGLRYVRGIEPATSKWELLIGTFNF